MSQWTVVPADEREALARESLARLAPKIRAAWPHIYGADELTTAAETIRVVGFLYYEGCVEEATLGDMREVEEDSALLLAIGIEDEYHVKCDLLRSSDGHLALRKQRSDHEPFKIDPESVRRLTPEGFDERDPPDFGDYLQELVERLHSQPTRRMW
ncbi:MAG: hypothetical protein AAF612_00210 [Planctomycetota bacterium]